MTTAAELDTVIEELTVDAYNDDEQLSGFLVGAEEALVRCEHATIAGVIVAVMSVEPVLKMNTASGSFSPSRVTVPVIWKVPEAES